MVETMGYVLKMKTQSSKTLPMVSTIGDKE
jgi:hypothetical protein